MFKKIIFILTFFFLLFFFGSNVSAEGEFFIDSEVSYEVNETGITTVKNSITIENVISNIFATSYTFSFENIDPQNPRATYQGKSLALESKKEDDKNILTLKFDDSVVGKGAKRTFDLVFEEDSFATRTGEVWEIAIPRLSQPSSFRSYKVLLSVPLSFDKEAYISPKPTSTGFVGVRKIYSFSSPDQLASGITAAFGKFQVFSFTLNYHIENPLAQEAESAVAIPPDTSFQKVYYQVFNPKPSGITQDADGNWLASYVLAPRQRIDIQVSGSVQIFSEARPYPKPNNLVLSQNLKESEFWQISDPGVLKLAKDLATPRAIYDYVSKTLRYDYERVKPNVERLGAKDALENPQSAICMEFTDLFIALSRAAGIPSREVNGYAYTENPEIQPLSLVADVLHAWPEYWDGKKQIWVPVDPTWGSTSGIDFFSKLDLRHFTFVVHGADPQKPYPPGSYKLGPNPQKDIFVSFGQMPEITEEDPRVTFESYSKIPLFGMRYITITTANPNLSSIDNLDTKVFFDDKEKLAKNIDLIPPLGEEKTEVTVPFSFLGSYSPENISVSVSGKKTVFAGFKRQDIIYQLIVIFSLSILIVVIFLLRLKKYQIVKTLTLIKTKLGRRQDEYSKINKDKN